MSNRLIPGFLTVLLVLCLSLTKTYAQRSVVDSLRSLLDASSGVEKVDVLNKLAGNLIYQNPEEATRRIKQALDLSDQLNYPEGKVIAWVVQGSLANNKSEMSEAEAILENAIVLAKKVNFQKGLAYANLSLGIVHIRRGNYDLAIESHFNGVAAARESDNPDLEVSNLINIGAIKQILQDLDEAIKYLREAMLIAEEYNMYSRLGQIYGNLGIITFNKNDFGQSIIYHEKGLALFRKSGLKSQEAISLLNIGLAYASLRDEEKAMEYYKSSEDLRSELGDELGVARTLRYKGELMNDLGRPKQASVYLENSLRLASKFEDKNLLGDIYLQLHEANEKLPDLKKAIDYYKAHIAIRDSIAMNTKKDEIAKLTAQFELDKLEKENALQQQESQIKDLKIAQRNQLLIALFILSLIIVLWLFWRSKNLKSKLVISQKDHLIASKELELRNKDFNTEKYQLVEYANQLLAKNELLEKKKEELQTQLVADDEGNHEVDHLIEKIRGAISDEKDWTAFNLYFDVLYPGFFDRLKDQKGELDLTPSEHRLISLMKINLSNKEIGGVLNISRNSVVKAKYRLRQKFSVAETREMEDFLLKL